MSTPSDSTFTIQSVDGMPLIPSSSTSTANISSHIPNSTNVVRSVLTPNIPSTSALHASITNAISIGNIFPTNGKDQPQFMQAPIQLQQLQQVYPQGAHLRQQTPIVILPAGTKRPNSITVPSNGATFAQSKIKIQGQPNQKPPSQLVPVNPQMFMANGQIIQFLPYGGTGMVVAQAPPNMKMTSPTKHVDQNSGINVQGSSSGVSTTRISQPQLLQMLSTGVLRPAQPSGGKVIYTVTKPISSTTPKIENGNTANDQQTLANPSVKKEATVEESPPTLIAAASGSSSISTESNDPSLNSKPISVKKASIYELHMESAVLFRNKRGPTGIIKHHIDGIEIEESDSKFPLDPAHKIMDLLPENALKKSFPQHLKRIEKVTKKRGRPVKVKEEMVHDENERISNVIIPKKNSKIKKTIKEEPVNEEANFESKSMNSSVQSNGSPSPQKKKSRVSELDKLKSFDFGPKEQGPRILETLSRSEDKKRQSIEREPKGKEESTRKSTRSTDTPANDSSDGRHRSHPVGSESPSKTVSQSESPVVTKLMVSAGGIGAVKLGVGSASASTSPSTSTIGLPDFSNGSTMCTFCKNPLNEIRLPSYPQFCSKRCVNEFRIHKSQTRRPERSAEERAEHMRNLDNILNPMSGPSTIPSPKLPLQSPQSQKSESTSTSKTDDLGYVETLALKDWQTQHVWAWIRSVTGSDEVANHFKVEEIDGDSLSMVKNEDLRNTFNMKLGPALKLGNCLEELKNSQKKFK